MKNVPGILLCSLFAAFGCAQRPAGSVPVAQVNGAPIPLASFESQAERLAQVPGNDFSQPMKRKELLEEMIKEELLFQAAMKEKLIGNSQRLKREIAREYLSQKLGQEKLEPTEDDVKSYFETKRGELEKVRASHILIFPKDPKNEASWNEAKGKAESILKKIRAEGPKADFAKYAKQFSNDTTKDQGGDLSYFTRPAMVKSFSDAAFELKNVGDISDVVKSEYGYHIIKLTGDERGLEAHKDVIRTQWIQERRVAKAEELFKKLKTSAEIKVYEDVLATVAQQTPAK